MSTPMKTVPRIISARRLPTRTLTYVTELLKLCPQALLAKTPTTSSLADVGPHTHTQQTHADPKCRGRSVAEQINNRVKPVETFMLHPRWKQRAC